MNEPLRHRPIDCRTAVERLWAYLDRELGTGAVGEVEAHLEACADCPPHFTFARTLLAEIRRERESGDLDALQSRVRDSLRSAGFQPVTP